MAIRRGRADTTAGGDARFEDGAPVRLRTADVTVAQVQAAKRVELYGQVAESSGLWLVFDVVWAARGGQS